MPFRDLDHSETFIRSLASSQVFPMVITHPFHQISHHSEKIKKSDKYGITVEKILINLSEKTNQPIYFLRNVRTISDRVGTIRFIRFSPLK